MDYAVSERESINDRNWSWSFLRREFHEQSLENLYNLYVHKIQHGYFSLFLILLIFLYLIHASVLLILDMKQIDLIWPDIVFYCAIVVLSLIALFMKETVGKTCTVYPISVTIVTIFILVFSNFFVPIYYYSQAMLRPIYTTQIIIACYAFLPIQSNLQAFLLGSAITLCHLIILGLVIYRKSSDMIYRLGCDTIFVLCINGMGLYFRFMNEILKRRTFLDKRAVVKSTLDLKHEKDQEEQLMLSILPQHIAKRVRDDIKNTVQNLKNDVHTEYKPFGDLHVEPHDDVTILYADIVRFTEMTRKLPVIKLVETLNELFGKFDDKSEEHNVLRIKFLGDCYYCVSGVPDKNPNHAINCVELAFDMIKIIQEVRRKRNLDIDMRIGIHTGKIFGGVIGDCKWQYDIWSKDVDITNHMEQTGKPGKVHITHQTLERLNDKYMIEPTNAGVEDELLLEHGIRTYLITSNEEDPLGEPAPVTFTPNIFNRRQSASINKTYVKPISTPVTDGTTIISHRRTAFMNHAVKNYRRRHLETVNKLQEAIEALPLRKFEQWFKWPGINPFFLTFRNLKLELPYFLLPDPIMKYYLLSTFFILVAMLGIQYLSISKFSWHMWLIYATLTFLIVLLIPLSWFHPLCTKLALYQRDFQWQSNATKYLQSASKFLANSAVLRIFIFLAVSSLITTYSVLNLAECELAYRGNNITTTDRNDIDLYCFAPWHMTQICCLTILASFLFLRIHLWLKIITGFVATVTFSCFIWNLQPALYLHEETWNTGLDPRVACIMQIAFLTFTLHLIDRQSEYLNKLDYQWKVQLASEEKEAQSMHEINNLLLRNILPVHVAQIYLDTNRSTDELYHEEYKSVAVMFASVINLTLKTDDKQLLVIMNEIISGFDRLLMKPCGQKIEKIKVINWTYMAACGLDPGRKDSTASVIRHSGDNIVLQMVKFAVNMINVLDQISDNYFQHFQLRIGISHGEVTAGVVGSKKPLYDVWGDTVNMASRMDSTGLPGEIQVTANTATILQKQGINCIYRGETWIKGLKIYIPTYFVDLNSSPGLIDNDSVR